MGSSSSREVATTGSQPVDAARSWGSLIISTVVGAAVGAIAAPAIAAAVPAGLLGFTLGTTAAGVLGNVVTKVAVLQNTLIQYIGTTLENFVHGIRTNTPLEFKNRVGFDVGDEFRFQGVEAKERRRMLFDFQFRVVPLAGTTPRRLDQSIAPSDLPEYDPLDTRTHITGDSKGYFDGIGWAIVEGALIGATGGGMGMVSKSAQRLVTIPIVKNVGYIASMATVTGIVGPIKNLAFPSTQPDHTALFIEFATEVQCQVNRLARCAEENGVGLEIVMRIGSTTAMGGEATAGSERMTAEQHDKFHWSTEERINLV